ncbi:hypothetical protein DPMN_052011 [Dreissena polymorpha]|uniref:Uncharacterized protein n=1 Tax=Dreissena polymorpha TaxID=45954 RepID=A0A9D4CKW7_DREPO|nr:hypothetical protein DPMN_052011 [Dreissena polymorpha]
MPGQAEPLQRSDACVGASSLTDADRPAEKEPVQRSKESVGAYLPTDKQTPVGAFLGNHPADTGAFVWASLSNTQLLQRRI